MRPTTSLSLFTASFLAFASNACQQQPAPVIPARPVVEVKISPPTDLAQVKGTDRLSQVRKLNRGSRVPSKWRSGHVTPRSAVAPNLEKTGSGFRIQMPCAAPVPTPTVHGGNLYVGGGFHSKEFYCFDAVTGKLLWGVDVDDDGPSSAVVADGVVVFNTESCTIFALDAKTGKQLWSWWLGDPLMTTPTILDGRVYTSYPVNAGAQQQLFGKLKATTVPAASHAMACFELRTGKVLWQKWIDGDVVSAPVAHGDEILATTFLGTVYRFDAKSGQIRFAKQIRATSAPVMAGERMFCTLRTDTGKMAREGIFTFAAGGSGGGGGSFGFSRRAEYLDSTVQGRSSFSAKAVIHDSGNGFGVAPMDAMVARETLGQATVSGLQAYQGSRILHSGGRNFNTMGDLVLCTDPASGKTLWKHKLPGDLAKLGGFLGTSPAVAGGDLFIGTVKGEVLQLALDSGEVKVTHAVGSPVRFQPAVVGGRIYVGTQDGKVVCIDTGNSKLTGWSTWGGNAQHNGQ